MSLDRRNLWTANHYRVAILFLVVFTVAISGCYNSTTGDLNILGFDYFKMPVIMKTGSHKVMVFSEMHYQRSHRPQDVPRIMPPEESVPHLAIGHSDEYLEPDMIGHELIYEDLDAYRELEIPNRVSLSYDPEKTAELYRVNCLSCHGSSMEGDGPIASVMKDRKIGPRPANLILPLTQDAKEGEIFGFITKGGRQGLAAVSRGRETRSPMPPFQHLLTEDDRWALVKYVLSD